ncbi:hypothetical protein GCM10011491_20570 [Brucella endophytica]|uniref:Uncharacterized protein n=1 Tax=Brucella endophytica TaxID=1963359 RepID=A0A916SDQ1_9HYPH|nr:hypothetical protein [Brucella endophytica]GGA92438.1 hypothetical protein GCM10011491_20570 [Brucella endophytica]
MTLLPYSRSCKTAFIRSGRAGGLAGELSNRAMVIRFIPLSLSGDKASIEQVLSDIVEEKCGLSLSEELRTDDFLGRLCSANSGCYGKIIEAVQTACFLVMHKGKGTVDRRAFAYNYQRVSA